MPNDRRKPSLYETLKAMSIDKAASENEKALALRAMSALSGRTVSETAPRMVDRMLNIASSSDEDTEDRLTMLTYCFTGSNVIFYMEDGEPHVYGEEGDVESACAVVAYAEGVIRERGVEGNRRRNALYSRITRSVGVSGLVRSQDHHATQKRLLESLERRKGADVVPGYRQEVRVDKRSERSFMDL